MTVDWNRLESAARHARANAYAPYSVYSVGAAALGLDGQVYAGCNVENASSGLTVCAERNAIAAMVAGGCKSLAAIAISTRDGGTPCGACRQVMSEFAPEPGNLQILCLGDDGTRKLMTLGEIFPLPFGLSNFEHVEERIEE